MYDVTWRGRPSVRELVPVQLERAIVKTPFRYVSAVPATNTPIMPVLQLR